MALSPFYNWSEPDNSSLVKNGAADIRTLGDAIDTSVWNVGFGQAGKNKIINGDFSINQRNFTSVTTATAYMFDRFFTTLGGTSGTATYTPQVFTPGTAPVAGYEGTNLLQILTASYSNNDSWAGFNHKIEGVRTLAGQTMTFSFWAKAATGTPKLGVRFQQAFGTGGSPSAAVNKYASIDAISTSWARYSVTITLDALTGKTIGTNKDDALIASIVVTAGSSTFEGSFGSMLQNNTFQIWGVQVEYGSKATPFQTASGGNPQAELAMCQRYYYRNAAGSANAIIGLGIASSTTLVRMQFAPKVTMRVAPTSIEYAGLYLTDGANAFTTLSSIANNIAGPNSLSVSVSVASGLTQFRSYELDTLNTTDYIAWSAEL